MAVVRATCVTRLTGINTSALAVSAAKNRIPKSNNHPCVFILNLNILIATTTETPAIAHRGNCPEEVTATPMPLHFHLKITPSFIRRTVLRAKIVTTHRVYSRQNTPPP
jgi:hypothetical protein